MTEPDSPKPIPTLQTALFVGSWLTSWWSLLKNSILMFGAPQDVVIVAPAVILLLGLILTNVQGYFDEKAREEFALAKAATVDGDMLFLLHRDGKRICSGKPTKAWKRLQVRQALGRGIPLSMVSFYLASRSVIEEPVCQLSATLSRYLITEKGPTETCKLTEALADQKRICSVDLPFGFGLGCQTSEELNQAGMLAQMRKETGLGQNETISAAMKTAEEAIWKSGHCSASTWLLQPNSLKHGHCGYEACMIEEAPISGPSKAFNELLYRLALKGAENSKEFKRSIQRLVRNWDRIGAFVLGLVWKQVLRIALPTTFTHRENDIDPSTEVVITSWRNWQMDFLLGFIFLVASMLPLAKAVQERRHLKFLINKIPIWIHFAIDILLVECAAVGILTSLFLHEGGGRITRLRDLMLKEVIQRLDLIADMELEMDSVDDLLENLYRYNDGFSDLALSGIRSVKGLADPLMVTGVFFLLFGIAVLFFCSLSTIFIRKTSVAQQMPWLTQWNAAIGGPLHLLGSVRDDEIKALSLRMHGQIILRGFLLTLLLGIFMFPVRSIDTALATAIILGKQTSRTPWILSWFALWGVHMVTGILAVNVINENQAFRDEDRWLRDMEAYGACGVPSQGYGMGMKPQGLPNTTAIPQSAPPGLQVPQSAPPGLQVPQVQPPGLQVPQAQPPGLQVPKSAPPGLQVPQAAPGVRIPPGPPGMQAQQP